MQLSLPRPTLPMRSLRAMLMLFVIFYLSFHAVSGERGIIAWLKAKQKLTLIEQELAEAKSKRELLSKRANLLAGPEIDADMLDEQARKVLGFAETNEIVVLESDKKSQ